MLTLTSNKQFHTARCKSFCHGPVSTIYFAIRQLPATCSPCYPGMVFQPLPVLRSHMHMQYAAATGAALEAQPAELLSCNPPLPVTVLSGFLGAGKTSLLKYVLSNKQGLKVAVLVNDMASINIDEALLADSVQVAGEEMVALQNGCICCSIREDLVREVRQLAVQGKFDYLVIESTGVSLPLPVAASFGFSDAEGSSLSDVAKLDTLVTVVDAERFVKDVLQAESLQDQGIAVDENDDRTVADLLIEQVEFADVLVLNKTDLVDSERVEQLKALLRKLNATAKIIPSVRSQVPLEDVLMTGKFDMAAAQQSPGWVAELNAFEEAQTAERSQSHSHASSSSASADAAHCCSSHSHDHQHEHHDHHHDHNHHHHAHHPRQTESEKYGITSFVYYARRPFHPQRLMDVALSKTWTGVLRTKGFFWLATRNDIMGVWQSAGGAWQGEPSAQWLCCLPKDELPEDTDTSNWDPAYGDRCQQLVWIGIGMDEAQLRSMLDACLLTDAEMAMGPEGWLEFEDPLPQWAVDEGDEWEEGDES